MKLKQLMDFEMDKDKKSSLQVKAIKALAGFLILMFLLTILSRAADSLTIAKVTASAATGGVISHNIETDGNITPNKDIAISTSADIKVASVEATEGKTVKKGDVLIQLDMDDLKTKLLKAQKDLAVGTQSGLDVAQKVLGKISDIAFIQMTSRDVVRHPLVQKIVKAYETYEANEVKRQNQNKEKRKNTGSFYARKPK